MASPVQRILVLILALTAFVGMPLLIILEVR